MAKRGGSGMMLRDDDASLSSPIQPAETSPEEKLQPSKDESIRAADVLCGRGRVSFQHVGNKRFRDAVANSLEDYMKANDRFKKSVVVHSIVEGVQQLGGRFLKKNHKTNEWYELSDQQAKEKVGHAIRDAVNAHETRKKKKAKLKPPPKDPDRKPSPLPLEGGPEVDLGHSYASMTTPAMATRSHRAAGPIPYRASSKSEPEDEADEHDHFLAKINAVLGPLPPDAEDPLLDESTGEEIGRIQRR